MWKKQKQKQSTVWHGLIKSSPNQLLLTMLKNPLLALPTPSSYCLFFLSVVQYSAHFLGRKIPLNLVGKYFWVNMHRSRDQIARTPKSTTRGTCLHWMACGSGSRNALWKLSALPPFLKGSSGAFNMFNFHSSFYAPFLCSTILIPFENLHTVSRYNSSTISMSTQIYTFLDIKFQGYNNNAFKVVILKNLNLLKGSSQSKHDICGTRL